MLRNVSFAAIAAFGLWVGQEQFAQADNCHGGYHPGYRPPVVYYGNPGYSSYRSQAYYGVSSGRPLYGGGYPGNWSYYGSGYGAGLNVPFGGFGAGGFPRSGSYGMGGFPHGGSYGMGGGFGR